MQAHAAGSSFSWCSVAYVVSYVDAFGNSQSAAFEALAQAEAFADFVGSPQEVSIFVAFPKGGDSLVKA